MLLAPGLTDDRSTERAVAAVANALAPRSRAIFVREPAIDPALPETSDLDFLLCAEVDDVTPERRQVPLTGAQPRRWADLAWIPTRWLDEPEALAVHGLVPHRLLSSRLVFDTGIAASRSLEQLRALVYRPDLHRKRVGALFGFGFLTVREIGITWDFPALALFWLHIAHVACLAAVLDALRQLSPNVYTRPLDYLPHAAALSPDLPGRWIEALRLDAPVEPLIAALRRIHAAVADRFPEPEWPPEMRACTRAEYRYWVSAEEVEWRIAVAREMVRRGAAPSAVFYLRFCAYALGRAPMVSARAAEGRDVAYLRPEMAVRPELQRLCPELVADLAEALGGGSELTRADVERSLAMTRALRDAAVAFLARVDLEPAEPKPWVPFGA